MTRDELLEIAKPILFNTDMVRAILEDRKGATRRLPRLLDKNNIVKFADCYLWEMLTIDGKLGRCKIDPPCKVGDVLYVRETWNGDWCDHYIYKADGGSAKEAGYTEEPKWKPSIHMPKEAARIFLRVTGVRVERLQHVQDYQIADEGIVIENSMQADNCFELFKELWNSTISKKDLDRYGWKANPWVWVIEFERVNVK